MAKKPDNQITDPVDAAQAPADPAEVIQEPVKAVEMVEITIPRANMGDEPNLFVSVNGKNWLLPKGKTSTVPKYIADEIKRSWKAQGQWDDMASDMSSADPALQ